MGNERSSTFDGTNSGFKTLRLAAMLVLALVISTGLWRARGPVVGVIAFAVYGALFTGAALDLEGMKRWSRRHPALDAAIIIPLTFLALCLLEIPLLLCAAIAIAVGAVFVPFVVWWRGRKSSRNKPLTSIPD